jgi:hypothetical protein
MMLYVHQHFFRIFYRFAQQKDQIKGMFGQYVAPAHIDRLLDDPSAALSFEGESKKMTVLFSDIRGFTDMSETLVGHRSEKSAEPLFHADDGNHLRAARHDR